MATASTVTTDHDEIRGWAEKQGGKPAEVERTHRGGDVGIVRIMFPNAAQSEHDALEETSWNEFFRQFDESKLVSLSPEERGERRRLVSRQGARRRLAGHACADIRLIPSRRAGPSMAGRGRSLDRRIGTKQHY